MTQPKFVADLHRLPEDDRIQLIGNSLMTAQKRSDGQPVIAGVVVDNDAAAERYVQKMATEFPRITLQDKMPGQNMIVLRFVRKDELH